MKEFLLECMVDYVMQLEMMTDDQTIIDRMIQMIA